MRGLAAKVGQTLSYVDGLVPEAQRESYERALSRLRDSAPRSSAFAIQRVVEDPVEEVIQNDGRIRRWAPIQEMEGTYLRVILLSDGEPVHYAFFGRRFVP